MNRIMVNTESENAFVHHTLVNFSNKRIVSYVVANIWVCFITQQ